MKKTIAVCISLMIVTLCVYWKVAGNDFILLDDVEYVIGNPPVVSGINSDSIRWAFTSVTKSGYWHPVTWVSHMLDVQLYGLNPWGHHLSGVIIHVFSLPLLFLLLVTVTREVWQSAFIAALFALHPLHVESVAWVAERKDVLSAFFCFLALLAYVRYRQKKESEAAPPVVHMYYILALFSYILGLMSKPMLVTLPVLLLLLDYWLFQLHTRDCTLSSRRASSYTLLDKVPFFALSIIFSVITIVTQKKGGAVNTFEELPLLTRLQNIPLSYIKYVGKMLYPHDLSVYYSFPFFIPPWQIILALLALVTISGLVILVRKRFPYLLVGWTWYLVTLLPVIGIIQVGGQAMADRFMHLPSIGLSIMATWGAIDLFRWCKHRAMTLTSLAIVIILTCCVLTWKQLDYWRDSVNLFRHALEVTSENQGDVYNMLNSALEEEKRKNNPAIASTGKTTLDPQSAEAHVSRGDALSEQGKLDEAINEYESAIKVRPDCIDAYNAWGIALANKGNFDGAIAQFTLALKINPQDIATKNNLELVRMLKKRGAQH